MSPDWVKKFLLKGTSQGAGQFSDDEAEEYNDFELALLITFDILRLNSWPGDEIISRTLVTVVLRLNLDMFQNYLTVLDTLARSPQETGEVLSDAGHRIIAHVCRLMMQYEQLEPSMVHYQPPIEKMQGRMNMKYEKTSEGSRKRSRDYNDENMKESIKKVKRRAAGNSDLPLHRSTTENAMTEISSPSIFPEATRTRGRTTTGTLVELQDKACRSDKTITGTERPTNMEHGREGRLGESRETTYGGMRNDEVEQGFWGREVDNGYIERHGDIMEWSDDEKSKKYSGRKNVQKRKEYKTHQREKRNKRVKRVKKEKREKTEKRVKREKREKRERREKRQESKRQESKRDKRDSNREDDKRDKRGKRQEEREDMRQERQKRQEVRNEQETIRTRETRETRETRDTRDTRGKRGKRKESKRDRERDSNRKDYRRKKSPKQTTTPHNIASKASKASRHRPSRVKIVDKSSKIIGTSASFSSSQYKRRRGEEKQLRRMSQEVKQEKEEESEEEREQGGQLEERVVERQEEQGEQEEQEHEVEEGGLEGQVKQEHREDQVEEDHREDQVEEDHGEDQVEEDHGEAQVEEDRKKEQEHEEDQVEHELEEDQVEQEYEEKQVEQECEEYQIKQEHEEEQEELIEATEAIQQLLRELRQLEE